MIKKTFVAPPDSIGRRLDVVVAAGLHISRSSALKLIKAGAVKVNGKLAKAPALLRARDLIGVESTTLKEGIEPSPDLPVLYEDKDIMVVDKPAGLSTHYSKTGLIQPTVAAYAVSRGVIDSSVSRAGIVHRLDKDTSGVLVIAKNPQAKAYMQDLFANRHVHKTYWAVVAGRLSAKEATINLPISRNRKQPVKRAVVSGGKAAVTHYKVLNELPGASLVEVTLETGRTHQIRVHFSHLGHPVLGDTLYGALKVPKQPPRQFLHAAEISFKGPSGKLVSVKSSLPPDLADYLESLKAGL